MRLNDGFCCYCGDLIVFSAKMTKEHIVPLSKGGNNRAENKTHCCKTCNGMRGNLSFEGFIRVVDEKKSKVRNRAKKEKYEIMIANIYYVKEYAEKNHDKLIRIKRLAKPNEGGAF
jgi:hypothetical protein